MEHEASPAQRERGTLSPWTALLLALTGTFIGITVAWIAWGLFTPGDFFAFGNPWLVITLGIAAISTARLSMRVRSRGGWVALAAVALCCAVFWGVVKDGWWASSPPPTTDQARRVPP